MRPGGRVLQGPPFRAVFSALPDGVIPFDVGEIEGRLPDAGSLECEVVVSEGIFGQRVPKPELGTVMPLELAAGTANLKIVGFFKMTTLVQAFPAIYGNKSAVDAIKKASPLYPKGANLFLIKYDGKASDIGKIIGDAGAAGGCKLYSTEAVADRFRSDTIKNLLSSIPMSLALAIITASSLLATVLMIGLAMKRRRIAELRCAGMTRAGVGSIILSETSVIIGAGWILGTFASLVFLQLFLTLENNAELPKLICPGWQTFLYSGLLAVVVGFLAVLIPIRQAMMVRPLEIVGGDITESRPVSLRRSLLAVLLLLPMPLLSVDFELAEKTKSLLMALVGFPCFVAAVVLGVHPLMCLTEKMFLRPLGFILRLDSRILQRRLSRDPARSAGTIITLALGLGGFIAIHIWGGTLMSSFVPSKEWPDAIVSILPNGLDDGQIVLAKASPGIADGKIVKIDCTQKMIDKKSLAFIGRKGEIPKGQILLFGTDPAESFGGDKPFAPFKFIEGDRESAIAEMESGEGCVIVSMLSRMGNLHVGDEIVFAGKKVKVSGVIDLNWHMVTSRGLVRTAFGNEGKRQRGGGRTASAAFVSEKFVREITGNDRTYFLWINMSPEYTRLGALRASVRLDEELRALTKADNASVIRVHHRDEIEDGTLAHGNDILGVMARIPFWSLVVTSSGIAALLIASAQGSKKEFQMMRAVGMTKSQLGRLIFGEAMLVTLCSVMLSMLCGILVGWSFTGLSRWMISSGLAVKLIIPWFTIGKGVLFAFVLCVIMAALPLGKIIRNSADD